MKNRPGVEKIQNFQTLAATEFARRAKMEGYVWLFHVAIERLSNLLDQDFLLRLRFCRLLLLLVQPSPG